MKLKDAKLEKKLNCEGFFGFGSGYGLGKGMVDQGGPMYCNLCPLQKVCWEKHKARVGGLVPALTEEFELMAKRFLGPELVRQWYEKYQVADPYTMTMAANLADGGRHADGMQPEDRGHLSLTWPLQERIQ
jgi:hypothetical protein